jgi:DNA/RNA-binding domain of Phe-tRNA-synthetase-like protein
MPTGQRMTNLTVDDHSLLDLRAFTTTFPAALGEMNSQSALIRLLTLDTAAPLASSDEVRIAVRDLLRHDGFKPTGRSKPASEYLIKAASEGMLSTINIAVDACNAVSLHSGLPISVVDLDVAREPFHIAIAPPGSSYVFNPSGQTIDVGGLLGLFDADGPCANAVKDSQRTKTSSTTRRTLSLIWGTNKLPGRSEAAEQWYQELLVAHGTSVENLAIRLQQK